MSLTLNGEEVVIIVFDKNNSESMAIAFTPRDLCLLIVSEC